MLPPRLADFFRPATSSSGTGLDGQGPILSPRSTRLALPLAISLGLLASSHSSQAGTWTPVSSAAPGGINLMLLLTDGTVMAQNGGGNGWYKLTPDSTGSYVNGTWSTLAPMHDTRLYGSSDVLRDGRVFIAGAEYGTGGKTAEVYDPLSNTWTMAPDAGQNFVDSISETLPNGNVLIAPVGPSTSGGTVIYNIANNTWSAGPTLYRGGYQDEASWVKLPDGSILTIDPFGTNSERYIPSLNQWVNDGVVPDSLYDGLGELGAAVLLPNGHAFFIGGTGHTALYTPSGNTSPGSWAAGPDVPNGQGQSDAPAAMMVNGVVLCAVGPAGTYNSPTSFYEYSYTANAFTAVNGPTGTTDNVSPYGTRMLDLPDGSVLYSNGGSQLYTYRPSGSALAAGKPVVTGISRNADGSYHLTGTLLNGISEGAAYGDDAQMSTNYPIIRLTDAGGHVTFGRTYGWSSTGVTTGSTPESTEFTVPASLPPSTYSLQVIANGISSNAVSFIRSFGGGLNAQYFDNMNFTGTEVARIDPTVNFNWGTGSPDPAIAANTFSARWTGYVQPRYSETYTFTTNSDDGVRLWVNGVKIIDNWTDHPPTQNTGTITLLAGQYYPIRMEYYQNGGGSQAQLSWSSASQGLEVVPSSQLLASIGGVVGDYFNNMTLAGTPALVRYDSSVNFNWGTGSPDPSIGVDHFSARWIGSVIPDTTDTYTFNTTSDDGIRLWVNGQKVIDNWTDHSPTQNSGTIALTAGQACAIQMEYYENGGGAQAQLAWSSSTLTQESVPTPSLAPAPAWSGADVGSVGIAGTATYSPISGAYLVEGSGSDIWGTADAFQFFSQPLTGNGQIVARVTSVGGTDPWAKAGVMIRESTAAGSTQAMMAESSGNGLAFQRRTTTNGQSTHTAGAAVSAPYWVKLVRSGTTFTAYSSPDGVTWTTVGSDTISMNASVLIGLAVTAHNNTLLNSSTFDNVQVTALP